MVAIACRNPRRMGEELFPPPPTRIDTLQLLQVSQIFLPAPDTKNAPFVFVGQTTDTLVGTWNGAWATQFSSAVPMCALLQNSF